MPRHSGGGRRPAVLALLLTAAAGCGSMPATAPTEFVVALSAATASLPAGGSTQLTARVTDRAGSPAPDGTMVLFSTTLGRLQPAEAATRAGAAVVTFFAGEAAGVAAVRAAAGGASSNPLPLPVGGAPVIISMSVVDVGGHNVLATADVQGALAVQFEWFFERRDLPEVVTSINQARYVYALPGFKDVTVRVTLADGRLALGSGAVVVE